MKRTPPPHSALVLLLLLLLGIWTSGCSTITGVDPGPLDFTAEQIRPGGDEPIPDFGVTGGDGEVRFQGAIGTPVPCYDIEGRVDFGPDVIELEVTASPRDVVCIQVVATFGYEGIVSGVDPGFYEVEIVHVRGDAREVVFEGAVEVE